MADKNRFPWLVALLAAATVQAAHAQDAPAPADALPQAMSRAPWWSSFQDATLNLLLAAADRSAPPGDRMRLQASVAADYVSARYNTLRLITTRELADATRRRLDLLQQDGGAEDEALREARRIAREAADQVVQLDAIRAASLARLAQSLDGYSPRMLALLLQPALQDTRLVLPSLDVPQQVPGVVLRRRADVAAAEADLTLAGRVSPDDRMRFARYVQALSTAIAPKAPSPQSAAAAAGSDIDEVLDRARDDVGRKLWQLMACMEAARRAKAALDAADADARAATASRPRGSLSELDALAVEAQLLVAADRMAAAAGAVGMAWVAYQASIGGAGSAQLSALLDAR